MRCEALGYYSAIHRNGVLSCDGLDDILVTAKEEITRSSEPYSTALACLPRAAVGGRENSQRLVFGRLSMRQRVTRCSQSSAPNAWMTSVEWHSRVTSMTFGEGHCLTTAGTVSGATSTAVHRGKRTVLSRRRMATNRLSSPQVRGTAARSDQGSR